MSSTDSNKETDEATQEGVLRIRPPSDGDFAKHLITCTHAFNQGNFRLARDKAKEVLVGRSTNDERRFSAEILKRTAIDPVALGVGLGCFVLFWLVLYFTLWH